jgi:hypothetical protein
MSYNINSGYGLLQAHSLSTPVGGKTFVVAASSSGNNYNRLSDIFPPDYDGVNRLHATPTAALAACTAGNGDIIYLDQSYATALTETELESAATKGVGIYPLLPSNAAGHYVTQTNIATLPQTADGSLFTITGKVKVHQIVGEVTTVIQTQANNTLLKINPTVGADVDICAALDISADADGSLYTITGTFADALINTASGAVPEQALAVVLTAGVLELECAASNTGAVKWTAVWEPVDPGAMMLAA